MAGVVAKQPPPHLSKESRSWWNSVVKEYSLEPHHLRVLQVCCESWDMMQQAREVLAEEGITVVGSRGQLQPHPASTILRDSRTALLRGIRELGLDESHAPGVS